MDNFIYVRAHDPATALLACKEDSQGASVLLAGGTDLIPLMKDGIITPTTVVDIGDWEEGKGIGEHNGEVMIGALTSLDTLAADPTIRRYYPALSQACGLAATPQLRNMGTIGGNLMQQTRCWYYRGPHHCWLKGGEVCFARGGENEYHSIFMTDPTESKCVSAHPSDPATALLAYDARVVLHSAQGEYDLPIDRFFSLPDEERRSFVNRPGGEIITRIVLARPNTTTKSVYRKAMARASWAFALAGVAVRYEISERVLGQVRVALSGVAPIPFRVREVEELLTGIEPEEIDLEASADVLVAGARPLAHNGYKVELLRALFKETLAELLERER